MNSLERLPATAASIISLWLLLLQIFHRNSQLAAATCEVIAPVQSLDQISESCNVPKLINELDALYHQYRIVVEAMDYDVERLNGMYGACGDVGV
jgi:hypothetical protein